MPHLSPLELRVLRAVQEHPGFALFPLAREVGEQPEILRSVLGRLRRFGMVSRERMGLLVDATWRTTSAGDHELREWAVQHGPHELPAGVLSLGRAHLARRRAVRHG